jgi:hypothetical protein
MPAMSTPERSPVLVEAEFSPKLVTYWVLDQLRILTALEVARMTL